MSRIRPTEYRKDLSDLDDMIRDIRGVENQRKIFVDFTRKEIAAADAQNAAVVGRQVPKTVFVNQIEGAPLESVMDGGSIRAEWHFLEEVVSEIGTLLVQGSPYASGRYVRSHILLVDGVEVQPTNGSVPFGEEYAFVNTVPYARRLERGWSRMTPEGIYRVVYQIARSVYGDLARITFDWRTVSNEYDSRDRNPAIIVRNP